MTGERPMNQPNLPDLAVLTGADHPRIDAVFGTDVSPQIMAHFWHEYLLAQRAHDQTRSDESYSEIDAAGYRYSILLQQSRMNCIPELQDDPDAARQFRADFLEACAQLGICDGRLPPCGWTIDYYGRRVIVSASTAHDARIEAYSVVYGRKPLLRADGTGDTMHALRVVSP